MNDSMDAKQVQAFLNHPDFQTLIRQKSRLSWSLAAIQLAIYCGFITFVALFPEIMHQSLFGGVITVGMPIGVAVILSAFILCGIYVWYANRYFDEMTRQVVLKVEA